MPTARSSLYRRHRFPPEVISYAVWLYFRFPLSLRMVEEMLAERGICVTYETVRRWGKKFGKAFSDQIRKRAPARGDKWHMDEVVVSIAGEQHWLWRAVGTAWAAQETAAKVKRRRRNLEQRQRLYLLRQGRRGGKQPPGGPGGRGARSAPAAVLPGLREHVDAATRAGRPVRLGPPPLALRDPGAAKQPSFQSVVGDVLGQRPGKPSRRRPFQIVLDRRTRHAKTSPDLARAHPIVVKPQ